MSNKRITDLTELTTPTTDDVFPVVDIATNTTTKVQLANLPVQTAVTTALATKQATLVSGTNIKTINSTTLLGSGDIAVQPTLVSGTSIKTVNSNSLLGAGDVAVQETLVSGTNIKTLNSVSLLGAGNIVLAATPSGVSGAIQFSNGSAFASDATNLFWDDTNNRLGVGTNAPTNTFEIASTSADPFKVKTTASYFRATFQNASTSGILDFNSSNFQFPTNSVDFGTSTALGARVGIKGSGSTSATTSLLVQNSAGTQLLKVEDGGVVQSGLIKLDNNGSGRGRMTGVEQINGTSGAGGTRFCTNPDGLLVNASAQLQVDSTTKGFLPPRMTTTERNAISSPAAGLMIYNTTTAKLNVYTTAWEAITSL